MNLNDTGSITKTQKERSTGNQDSSTPEKNDRKINR